MKRIKAACEDPNNEDFVQLRKEDEEEKKLFIETVEVAKWEKLGMGRKVLIIVAAIMETIFIYMVELSHDDCFRKFEVSSSIDDPESLGGLDGNALNVIKTNGIIALSLFFVGAIIIYVLRKQLRNQALKNVENNTGKIIQDNTNTKEISNTKEIPKNNTTTEDPI